MDTTETTEEKVEASGLTGHKWYIISSSSGKENSTAKLIKQRIKANNLEDHVTDVVVPTQEKVIIQRGKKKTIEDRIFPGYILVRMLASDEILHILRNTEGVLGFLGMTMNSKKPSALSDKEAKGILEFTQMKQEPVYQTQMSVGDAVKVIEGTWKDFIGTITDINASKGKATVLLSIFDRDTPVEVDLLEISTISNT